MKRRLANRSAVFFLYDEPISVQIHTSVSVKLDALRLEQTALNIAAAKGEGGRHATVAIDNAMTRDHARLRIVV